MAPGHRDFVQTASLFIDSQPRLERGVLAVRIIGKKRTEHDFVRPGATYGEGITDDRPLRFTVETQNLAQIMNQSGQDEPTRVAVMTDLFSGLEQVIKLREVGIGVAVVHEGIKKFQG